MTEHLQILDPAPDGTLFTVFLDTLNNKCDSDETTSCTTDADCTDIGNELCGLAGYRDWEIPNVKRLQIIVDYSVFNPSSSVPGAVITSYDWSSTTLAFDTNFAWFVDFFFGGVNGSVKYVGLKARAVRPCS
ncbi:MAG: Lcl C-terminal domain-containing protein [Candidatus Anammoxibacter sp.]